MREIRCWDRIKKKWLTKSQIKFNIDGTYETFGIFHNSIDTTEYTGLKDKEGKKIFKGDILKHPEQDGGTDGVVIFNHFSQYMVEWNRDEIVHQAEGKVRNIKHTTELHNYSGIGVIIGNIFENPELLK